jgi:uncharacterized membrane protein
MVFLGLLGLAFLRFAQRYAHLPSVVASHFGAGGRPNGWMNKQDFLWMSLVMVGVATIVGFIAPLLVERLPPSLINLPNKEYWLAPERRAETLATFGKWMEWFGSGLIGFFTYVYELVFDANIEHRGLSEGPFLIGLVLFMGFALGWSIAFLRRFSLTSVS